MNFLYDTVKNIVIYLLLVTIVINLIGNSSYKKYVSVFTGMILILIIVKPIMTFFHMEEKFDYYTMVNRYTVSEDNIKDEINLAEESRKDRILEDYEQTIREQLAVIADNYDLVLYDLKVDIGTGDSNYGRIEGMEMTAGGKAEGEEESKEESSVPQIIINKVEIEKIELNSGQKEEHKDISGNMTIGRFRKEAANLYGIEEEKIKVYGKEQ